jgi:DNA polymerase elongation subunit (family B)
MKTARIEGWLFDIDEFGSSVTLWVYDTGGKLHRLTHDFSLPVYAGGAKEELKRLAADLYQRGFITGGRWVERLEFWSGREMQALQLNVSDSSQLPCLREIAGALDQKLSFYNLDIPAPQYYLYLSGLFPLCRLECIVDEWKNVREVAAKNSAYDIHHTLPALSVLKMRGEKMRPLNPRSRITVEWEGERRAFHLSDGAKTITELNALIERIDPDLIVSEHGDTVLFPALLSLAKQVRLQLWLDRDRVKRERKIETEGRTFLSYQNPRKNTPSIASILASLDGDEFRIVGASPAINPLV